MLNLKAVRNEKLLRKENALLRAALERILDECGDVCPDFDICEHPACRDSCLAWMIAEAALRGEEMVQRIP